jgi:hypothetical protein
MAGHIWVEFSDELGTSHKMPLRRAQDIAKKRRCGFRLFDEAGNEIGSHGESLTRCKIFERAFCPNKYGR